jgi:hypothetical protein
MATATQPTNGSRCSALTKRGQRCGKASVEGDLCLVHAGKQDMKALGAKGGSTPKMTALRRAAIEQDDSLREQAREVLAKALRGEEVPKAALDSARSLFSYRASVAPAGEQARGQQGERRMQVGLVDLVRVAAECGILRGDNVTVGGEPVAIGPAAPPPPTPAEKSREVESGGALQRSQLVTAEPAPPMDAPGLAPHEAPADFDESTAARLRRRYGDDTASGWWWA